MGIKQGGNNQSEVQFELLDYSIQENCKYKFFTAYEKGFIKFFPKSK